MRARDERRRDLQTCFRPSDTLRLSLSDELFSDSYFDLIFTGSAFTHIDDLAEAWLLELRRLLSEKGRVYITIHDRHTIALLDAGY